MSDNYPPADTLQILMIALGDEILSGWGDVRERHLEYAERVAHLHMLVYSPLAHDYQQTALSDNLTVYPTRSRSRLSFLRDALQQGQHIIYNHPIHTITTQDPFSTGLVGVWLKRRSDIPVQIQNHSSFFDNNYWVNERPLRHELFNILGRWVLNRADTYRTVNHSEREKYITQGLPADRIRVIPVSPRLEPFLEDRSSDAAKVRAQLAIPPDASVLLWVGRPARVKRIDFLLDAFAQVYSHHPDAHLLLVSDLSSRPDVHARIERLALSEVVHIVGNVTHADLPAYYQMSNLYVHSSAYEGFGLVLAEAAASARPVVSTRTAGAQEIVADGQTGILCDIDDSAALAAAASDLLERPSYAASLGEAARAHVVATFDRARNLDALIDAWRQTAAMRHTR